MSRLPNLIVIGAAKCGSSSLHYYLGNHPEIYMSRKKELAFFIKSQNWNKGVNWYKSQFNTRSKICGETTPGYSYFPGIKGVPEMMYLVIPEAKIIYIIRDPIERIISAYIGRFAAGKENRSINIALENLENNSLVYPSKYFMQLEQYLPFFEKSNIKVLALEDLKEKLSKTMKDVFLFLEVDDHFISEKNLKILNPSITKRRKNRVGMILRKFSETTFASMFTDEFRRNVGKIVYLPFSKKIIRPIIDESIMEKLRRYFEEDVRRIKEFTGNDFKNWLI
jgi:hypothetical protein